MKVNKITKKCFLPVAVGGGIKEINDCYKILDSGADKVVINSEALKNVVLINQISQCFGKQFVVCSVDIKKQIDNRYEVWYENGSRNSKIDVFDLIKTYEANGAGEIYVRSMDRDGIQSGYDIDIIRAISQSTSLPIVAAGGVGEYQDLSKGIEAGAMAVSIGNLFHFVGIGLIKAREYMRSGGVNIPDSKWNFSTSHGELK